jgi:dipeptidase
MRLTLPALGLLLLLPVNLVARDGLDCFAVLVGSKCTADGAVLLGHNEDDGLPAVLYHWQVPRRHHPEGAVVRLAGGGTLPQVPVTWGYLWSQMVPGYHHSDLYINEHGLTVCSNASPSREDKPALTDGGIGFMLRRLIAGRCRTAREGVDLATGLLARFGYSAQGRTFLLADPREAWVLCLVKGKHWVAARVPDNKAMVMANTYPVHEIDFDNTRMWRTSPGLVAYARARGWYDPERDGTFDFALAFAQPGGRTMAANVNRSWRAQALLARKPVDRHPKQPLFFTPRPQLTPADLMALLRDHYEGTTYDLSQGYLKGNPNRNRSRPICCQATRLSVVAQLRPGLPPAIGALLWLAMARPDTSVYQPWYLGSRILPAGYGLGVPATGLEATLAGRTWSPPVPPAQADFRRLRDHIDREYGPRLARFLPRRRALEMGWFKAQARVERDALRLHGQTPDLALDFLTVYTLGQGARARKLVHDFLTPTDTPAPVK